MPARTTKIEETQIIKDILRQLRRHRANAIAQEPIWKHDTFTAPATYQLTYIPYGINALADNGSVLSEGTDYTVDYTTGLITFTVGRTAGHVIYVSYVTNGDLVAASGPVDFGGFIPGGVGRFSTNGTPVVTANVTLDHATAAGDICVVLIYTTAGNFPATISGLGATWTLNNSAGFSYAVGVGCTAGQTAIAVTYGGGFSRNATILAASFHGAGTWQWFTTGSDSVTPATVDVLKGNATLVLNHVGGGPTGTPSAGQGSVIGWVVEGGSVGTATTSFTDTNGTYAQVGTPASGNGVTVEMGYATVLANGGTDHVGNRSDSPTVYEGIVVVFDAV